MDALCNIIDAHLKLFYTLFIIILTGYTLKQKQFHFKGSSTCKLVHVHWKRECSSKISKHGLYFYDLEILAPIIS